MAEAVEAPSLVLDDVEEGAALHVSATTVAANPESLSMSPLMHGNARRAPDRVFGLCDLQPVGMFLGTLAHASGAVPIRSSGWLTGEDHFGIAGPVPEDALGRP